MLAEAYKRITRNLYEFNVAIEDPSTAQDTLREGLYKDYRSTLYGEAWETLPAITYHDLEPWLRRVREEDYRVLLTEEPLTWVMTRGTSGKSKIIPVTQKHMDYVVKGGSRAILKHSVDNGGLVKLMGGVLNLQFPSNASKIKIGQEEVEFGFSSGTYAKLNPMLAGLRLVPRQEEIDALQTGLSVADWEKRYEFIYQKAREEKVVTVMGVAPVQTGFARYMKKKHGVYPRDVWSLDVVFTTSVAKIQSRYKAMLRKTYGDVPVVEMYTATEGAFGQQMDQYPYWRPNYDLYLFEVETGKQVKMLYELKRGEWGRLIISTPILPRYRIGDLVEAMGNNYFRVFGRDRWQTVAEHRLYRLLYWWV